MFDWHADYGSKGTISTKEYIDNRFGVMLMETITRKKSTYELFVARFSMKGWCNRSSFEFQFVEYHKLIAVFHAISSNVLSLISG